MKVDSMVAFNDDQILNEIEMAILAADDADTQARYDITAEQVIEELVTSWTVRDQHTFMTALRIYDKQKIAYVLTLISDSFEKLVKEKAKKILTNRGDE